MTGHSKRGDRCGACRSPLYVCPSTIRVHVRCCHACTHHTPLDDKHNKLLQWQTAYRKANR